MAYVFVPAGVKRCGMRLGPRKGGVLGIGWGVRDGEGWILCRLFGMYLLGNAHPLVLCWADGQETTM